MCKAKDLARFEKPVIVELGKVNLFGGGRKVHPIVLEFDLYRGKGTYREKGEEFCAWNCYVYKPVRTGLHAVHQMPDYDLNYLIEKCGFNPMYREPIETLRDTYAKYRWKYTSLIPLEDVAKMIDAVLFIEKIAKGSRK